MGEILQSDQLHCGQNGHAECIAPELTDTNRRHKASEPSYKVDIWALGVVIYWMIKLERPSFKVHPVWPFARVGGSNGTATKNPKHAELIKLLDHLLEPDPNKRWSAKQVCEHRILEAPVNAYVLKSLLLSDKMKFLFFLNFSVKCLENF